MSTFFDADVVRLHLAHQSKNPFLQAGKHDISHVQPTTLDYVTDGKYVRVSKQQYDCYEHIWNQMPQSLVEANNVEIEVAVNTVKKSMLSDEELGELWDIALSAKISSSLGCGEYHEGFMSKVEFFVLLSELQHRLSITTDQLVSKLGLSPMLSTRTNPFKAKNIQNIGQLPTNTLPRFARDSDSNNEKEVVGEIISAPSTVLPSSGEGFWSSLPDLSKKTPLPGLEISSSASVSTKSLADESPVQDKIVIADLDENFGTKIAVENADLLQKSGQVSLPIDLTGLHTIASEPIFNDSVNASIGLKEKISFSQLNISNSNTAVSSPSNNAPNPVYKMNDFETYKPVPMSSSPSEWHHLSTQSQNAYELSATNDSDQEAILLLENLKNETAKGIHKPKYGKLTRLSSVTNSFKKIRIGSNNANKVIQYPDFLAAELLENAALQGNVQLLASLLKHGADVKWGSVELQKPHNALVFAAKHGHFHAVSFLAGRTPLQGQLDAATFQAIVHGHVDIAVCLIEEYGADIYLKSAPNMKYPLLNNGQSFESFDGVAPSCFEAIGFCESQSARMKLLNCLLGHKSFQPDAVASFRYLKDIECCVTLTALAVFTSMRWTEGVKKLLEAGANANSVRTNCGKAEYEKYASIEGYVYYHFDWTVPPICFLNQEAWSISSAESFVIAELLFQHSARGDIESTNPFKRRLVPPIFRLIRAGNLAAINLFLANGADPDVIYELRDLQVSSPLQLATQMGNLEIVRALIDSGAQVHKIEHGVRTPLWISCHLGFDTIVALLLQHQAHKTGAGADECLKAAVRNVNATIVRQLLDEGVGQTCNVLSDALNMASNLQRKDGYIEMLDVLMMHDATLNGKHLLLAINADNYIGLERVLSRATELNTLAVGIQNETFQVESPTKKKTYLAYARSRGLHNFVRLLQGYGFKDE